MAKKYLILLIVLLGGSVAFYLGVETEDVTNIDKTSTEILTTNDVVKSSSSSTYNTKFDINILENKQLAEDKKKAVQLNTNNTLTREFENKIELNNVDLTKGPLCHTTLRLGAHQLVKTRQDMIRHV